jgi:N-acyl-D-aspartate/D-glutamate deacylase
MTDTLITGGYVVDGTGAPGGTRDVAIRDGRFIPVGDVSGSAEVIDASGLVVAPGFVDVHTHYDAQLSWDPAASPSPLHGVTTAIGGNCGFTLAPAGEAHADYLMRLMARVEGMPLAALEAGLPWDWKSYADWVGRFDGHLGINAGFLTGHSAIRRVVMGEACHEPASDEQIREMARLVTEACRAGALGFSTSRAPTHNDGDGEPVPSRGASLEELVTLASAVAEIEGTTLAGILDGSLNGYTQEETELLTAMSAGANRPINWNVLGGTTITGGSHTHQLAASDYAAAHGGRVVALTLPHSMGIRLSFLSGFALDGLPGWGPVIKLPIAERMQALSDPDVRRRLREGAASDTGVLRLLANWSRLQVVEVTNDANRAVEGRTIGEIAAERGADPFDVLCDIVVADDLRTGLRPAVTPTSAEEWKLRADVWRDPRTVVGGSDAGAHLDMMCGATYSTAVLAHGVREFGVISLEEAVEQLSDVPARLYGLRGRGRIADGYAADTVLFDLATVGYETERMRDDLPGGAWRLYAEGVGIHHVLVNGTAVVHDGRIVGNTPGTQLQAGRDTYTVTP